MSRLQTLLAMNPEFAQALARGESWALQHADAVEELDGGGSRRHPERNFRKQVSQNWCGSCPFADGCMSCDLDGNHKSMKDMVGTIMTFQVSCTQCRFREVTETTSREKAIADQLSWHKRRHSDCRGKLKAKRIRPHSSR